jgi:hypothetical protein
MQYVIKNHNALIGEAFAFLWRDNLSRQKSEAGSYNPGQYYYVTASDVEAQVRLFIEEDLEHVERGSKGRAWGRGYSRITVRGNLLSDVRKWLLCNLSLERHNFGRGHVSGMRFRPRGAPLHPSEVQTMERRERRKANGPVIHFKARAKGGSLLCSIKPRSPWSRHKHRVYSTEAQKEVTCPRCAKALSEGRSQPKWWVGK